MSLIRELLLKILLRKEVQVMAVVYATLISSARMCARSLWIWKSTSKDVGNGGEGFGPPHYF